MPYSDLRHFIQDLRKKELLVDVTTPISMDLELTEIHTRLLDTQGPAILVHKAQTVAQTQASMPVLTNMFGTRERIALAMGRECETLRQFGAELAQLRQPSVPKSLKDAADAIPMAKRALAMRPKTVKHAPAHEIVLQGDDVDLDQLPIQKCWPGEPAPLITWPLVITNGPHPDKEPSDNTNLGIYRMQVTGRNTALLRWLKHRGGAQHARKWQNSGNSKLPVAVAIGANPATILAAVTPIPDNLSEYQFAGLLRNARCEITPARTVPIMVPACAEIVLEGTVDLADQAEEGPYGDHTGYYNVVELFPKMTVHAITMRKDPIYLTTFTGRPPDEPSVLGEALNELFIPLLQQQFPEITDFWLPPEGCSYRIGVVAINKAYPGHAKRIMMGIWSFLRQFMYTKWIIVVDHTINIRDWKDVMWAISTKMDPVRDITTMENTPIDYLDFASPHPSLGSKIGLDATDKIPPETSRDWGEEISMHQDIIDIVDKKWSELHLPGGGKSIW
ncbi:MAG: UbiD family decarboxylase [Pseudomonadota bacterium]